MISGLDSLQAIECLSRNMINREMHINGLGVVVGNEWFKTEAIRDNVNLDAFVIMPNHVHEIIEIIDKNPIVGANRDSPLRNKTGINNSFYKSKFESPSNNIG